ncbi:MAG: antitoxin [Acidimicrobiia bacterium]|nr:antitoxin [Acidimicrobiia bacterium]
MRTTVTLDTDVAMRLRAIARERDISFKEALNSAVRAGLASTRGARAYEVPHQPMRLRPGVDLDRALALAAELEDAETMRELERRK